MSPEQAEPPAEPATPPGVFARAAGWARAEGTRASAWVTGARSTHPSVDVGFRLAYRDKRVAAGVLAGGIAYRLFFWYLSLSLLVNGTLGFADGHRVEQALLDAGLTPVAASTLADLSQQSQQARWWLVVVGGWLLLWTGYLGAKALVLVHAAVWDVPATPVRRRLWASLGFTGAALGFVGSMVLVQWVRANSHVFGVLVAVASAAVPLLLWLAVSSRLPHRGSGWRVLLPGALVVALGVHAFYLFTLWFLGPKLDSATSTYGLLGIVATLLFWLYLVGRLVIGGATLNAAIVDRRDDAAAPAS